MTPGSVLSGRGGHDTGRRLGLVLLIALSVLAGLLPAGVAAAAVPAGWERLAPATHAETIAFGPEGTLWATEAHSPGTYETPEYSLAFRTSSGASGSVPLAGPIEPEENAVSGGYLWSRRSTVFVAHGREHVNVSITRTSTGGETIGRPIPGAGSIPGIAIGPEGSTWFTFGSPVGLDHRPGVGRLGPAGELTLFELGPNAEPSEIVSGPGGDLWFLVSGRGGHDPEVARISPAGQVTRFPLPHAKHVTAQGLGSGAGAIVAGGDGDIWVSDGVAARRGGHRRARIARVGPTGRISTFLVPGNSAPSRLTDGPDGLVWFATHLTGHGQEVDSIAPDGTAGTPTCLQVGRRHCEIAPYALAAGPAETLWFAGGRGGVPNLGGGASGELTQASIEGEAGYIGRFEPPPGAIAR